MNKRLFSPKNIFVLILFILMDICVYLFLGVAMMAYDDFYEPSKGAYLSWGSMTGFDKTVFVSLQLWNLLNLFMIGFVIFKIYKYFKIRND